MTILNVNASAARVLVCMDSEVVALDRLRRAEQGKLMYLSNTNVVIGVRGIQVFAFELHWAAWNMPDASFDALDQAWAPEVFDAGFSQFVRVSRERGTQITDADAAGAEVVIAGYSERRGRMAAIKFMREDSGAFSKWEIGSVSLAPSCDWETPPTTDSVAAMTDVARQQVAHWQAREPSEAIGGTLVFAVVTREGATFSHQGLAVARP